MGGGSEKSAMEVVTVQEELELQKKEGRKSSNHVTHVNGEDSGTKRGEDYITK